LEADIMSGVFYVDGSYITADDATIPVSDLAILRGYGVFDFLRTYHGRPFQLEAHIDRLYNSAAELEMPLPWEKSEVIAIVNETLARNNYPESNIRIVVTGGDSMDSITPNDTPRLVVIVIPAPPPPIHLYTNGAKIITVQHSRYVPAAKSLNYIPAIRALRKAQAAGAVEAIYVNEAAHVLEGTTTNLFAFFGDRLVTPDDGILPGITRGVVLELAEDMFEVEARTLHKDELLNADEVFITSSNKQIVPVVQIDDHSVNGGSPGPRTRRIMDMFGAYTGVPLLPTSTEM
jgi:branched-chain amino acid aminotransferase